MVSSLSRRTLLGGIGTLLAAPAIVRASSLMPVRVLASDFVYPRDLILVETFPTGDFDTAHMIAEAHRRSAAQAMMQRMPIYQAAVAQRQPAWPFAFASDNVPGTEPGRTAYQQEQRHGEERKQPQHRRR